MEAVTTSEDRAMTQAVSRRPLTAKVRVCTQVSPCGICCGQSGTGSTRDREEYHAA
jgi:hypothetical protein